MQAIGLPGGVVGCRSHINTSWKGLIAIGTTQWLCAGLSGGSGISIGLPFGLNSNLRPWKEHLLSSSLPPVHHKRLFQVCASDCI